MSKKISINEGVGKKLFNFFVKGNNKKQHTQLYKAIKATGDKDMLAQVLRIEKEAEKTASDMERLGNDVKNRAAQSNNKLLQTLVNL
jgi:hypothetical protein